jgi:hypothetical protein
VTLFAVAMKLTFGLLPPTANVVAVQSVAH